MKARALGFSLLTTGLLAVALGGCASTPSTTAETTTSAASTPAGSCPPADGAATRTTTFTGPPPMCIDPEKSYAAQVTTDVGAFTIALDAKRAPRTVNNFVVLARHRYYDGVTFHRVIKGFMAQGGDPEGTGSGGPGYTFADELPEQGEYEVGSVAMANTGMPGTNGSQFFIVTGEAGVQLPPTYSLFGRVTSGMATVSRIEADGSVGDAAPATVHRMTSVRITES